MTYKGLTLKGKVIDAIKSFREDVEVTSENKGRFVIYAINIPKEKEALIHIYPVKGGKTTIYAGDGKNTDLSLKVAKHIITECEVAKIDNKILSITKMTNEEYDALIEFLVGCGLTISDEKNLTAGVQKKITSKDGGTLYLNKWESGTFSVQGTCDILKGIVIEGLTNLLPYKEVIEAQLNSLKVKSSVDDILIDLKKVLPVSFDFLESTLHTIISPALVLKRSELEVLDYSCFTFPALRGLEGYIKKLFLDNEIVVSETFSEHIDTGKVLLKDVAKINNAQVVEAIEKCYEYYKNNRHLIFHVDGTIIGTRIIEDVNVADSIINDTFTLIESTYKKIRDGK